MENIIWIDRFPLAVTFIFVVFISFVAIEVGYRLGRHRYRTKEAQEKAEPVGSAVGSTLALLAFILAFTFGMAASRFDARKAAVLDEANAVGTAYLRAELIPATHQEAVRALLREYVDVRLKAVQVPGYLKQALVRSKELHDALWAQAVAIATQYPPSVNHSLFVQSINEIIDLHGQRVAVGIHSRIPGSIWLALFFVAIMAMASMGYQAGLSGSRRTMTAIFLTLAFSSILMLIAVLDRPGVSMSLVSQQAMIDLQQDMKK